MPQRTGRRQKTAGRGSKKPGKEKPKRQEDVKRSSMRASSYQGPRTGQTGNGKRDGSTERVRGIIQKYLEPEREREREIQRKKKEIMASKARREKNRREIKESAISRTPRVSYVRKPFASRSKISMFLTAAALLLGGGGIYGAVSTQGQATQTHGAMGLCSMILSAFAIWYGGISFLEDDKNYILARLGIGISVLVLIGWALVVAVGLGGFGS